MKLNYLKTDNELQKWDDFLLNSPRGHYAQLSTWLKSFEAYGAAFQIIVAEEDEKIVGGMGLVIFGKGPFKLVTVPIGPIIAHGFEHLDKPMIAEAVKYAKKIGAFLFQLRIPYIHQNSTDFLLNSIALPESIAFEKGFPFKVASTPNILFLVHLKQTDNDASWEEEMLNSFKSNTRRNIRKSMRNGLTIAEAVTDTDLQEAYAVIEQNGVKQGYSVRTWKEFGPTLIEQVRKKQAVVMTVKKEDQLLGAHYGIIAGKRYSYSMGGTKRIEKDYLVGHFLHWHVIKKAKKLGLRSYDFTSRGSPGVMRFKNGFKAEIIEFDAPYYVVLSKPKFFIFNQLFPMMKKHKKQFAKLASSILAKK